MYIVSRSAIDVQLLYKLFPSSSQVMGHYGISIAMSVSTIFKDHSTELSAGTLLAVGSGIGNVHVYTNLETKWDNEHPVIVGKSKHPALVPPYTSDHLPFLLLTSENDKGTWDDNTYSYQNEDNYGASLAMHQNILAVGAPWDDYHGQSVNSGAVYIYNIESLLNITLRATLYLSDKGGVSKFTHMYMLLYK